jgi:RNA polymerase-binding transcription factor DksA
VSFENMVDADLGSAFEQKHLETRLANRIKYSEWDGNPRQCYSCGRGIEEVRLKLLNATQCSSCVKQKDEDEDEV